MINALTGMKIRIRGRFQINEMERGVRVEDLAGVGVVAVDDDLRFLSSSLFLKT